MRVGTAREIALDWVMRYASSEDWFKGAHFSGSTVDLPDDAELPPTSDIDVVLIGSETVSFPKPGKLTHQGVLLDVTYRSWHRLASVEDVCASYHLANCYRTDTIIADPTGDLEMLQAEVARSFDHRDKVRCRAEDAWCKAERLLGNVDHSAPRHDQVTSWLFGTGVMAHVPLVAALRNPTVRLRFLAAREVLDEYGHHEVYESLLHLLGCGDLTAQRVDQHLSGLARTFDATVAVSRTSFFFSADITARARPVAIDGSRELIKNGHHREAMFWILATFTRCHKILAADASSAVRSTLSPAFSEALTDVGITSPGDLGTRASLARQYLPTLWKVAEEILSKNPVIVDLVG